MNPISPQFQDTEVNLIFNEFSPKPTLTSNDFIEIIEELNRSSRVSSPQLQPTQLIQPILKSLYVKYIPKTKASILIWIISIGKVIPFSTTKYSWYKVIKYTKCNEHICKWFTPMSLLKMWKRMKNCNLNIDMVVSILKKNESFLNTQNINVKEISKIISKFNLNETVCDTNVDFYSDMFIKNVEYYLNNKIKINKKKNSIQNTEEQSVNNNNLNENIKYNNSYIKHNNNNYNVITYVHYSLVTSDEYKKEFNTIDEIVDTFKNIFPNISYQQILHTLDINSFDINNTYLQLQYPLKYNLSFNKIDDYIITHMSNEHTLYKSLVSLKGEQSLLRRKRYLNKRMAFFN